MSECKEYLIGGRTFRQMPLTCGQAEYLIPLFQDMELGDPQKLTMPEIILKGKDRLYAALTVLLIQDGESRADVIRRLDTPGGTDELVFFFRCELETPMLMKVINDFFAYSPLTPALKFIAELTAMGVNGEKVA